MTERVAVFIDYQNCFAGARGCFHAAPPAPWEGQFDPRALAERVVARRRRPSLLAGVRVYRGLPDRLHDPRAYAANQRQAAAWRSRDVDVIQLPLRYPPRWPAERAQEKGVDVALAIDFVAWALDGRYDVGVLFSTDTDLVPALRLVASRGRHVEVAAWWTPRVRARLHTSGALPWCHQLRQDDYLAVHDPRDYRKS